MPRENRSYRQNHFVPSFMIAYWADIAAQRSSVNVFDIEKDRSFLSTGEGRSPYSFASQNDLYVPRVDGKRATSLERWFSEIEGSLAHFARQAHSRISPIDLPRLGDVSKVIVALLSLQMRSPRNLDVIQSAIEGNPSLHSTLDPEGDDTAQRVALENIIHCSTDRHHDFLPVEFRLGICPCDANLILTESPTFVLDDDGWHFAVLTNRVLVGYRKNLDGNFSKYVDLPPEFVAEVNDILAMRARRWIVAKTAQELEPFIDLVRSDRWKNQEDETSVTFYPTRWLRNGWRILD